MMMMMGFGMMMMMVVPLLLIAAVVYGLGVRPQFGQTGPLQSSQTPLEILKARYADGEITPEEYDSMRRVLED